MEESAKATLLVVAQTFRQQQVTLVGSETLYNRLDKKLKDLEIDPFFYNKQCKLIYRRYFFLKEVKVYGNGDKLTFLSTQCFDKASQKIGLEELPEINLSLGLEAATKFMIPEMLSGFCSLLIESDLHTDKDDGLCECWRCKQYFGIFTNYIRDMDIRSYPESIAYTDLAIRSGSIRSLKTVCMAKVVELGLAQDCLPLSVQENIKNGPELADGDRRTQMGLKMLQRAVSELDL